MFNMCGGITFKLRVDEWLDTILEVFEFIRDLLATKLKGNCNGWHF